MSSTSWKCEEDIWEDLKLMSTASAAGAAARASSELAKLHAPVRMPQSESFGLVRTIVPSPTPQEMDPWSKSQSPFISSDEESRMPRGVKTDTKKPKVPKGRASRFANTDATGDFITDLENLQREMQECGVTKNYSNKAIKQNYEKHMAQRKHKSEPPVPVITLDSDSEDKTTVDLSSSSDIVQLETSSSTSTASSASCQYLANTKGPEIWGEFNLYQEDFPKL